MEALALNYFQYQDIFVDKTLHFWCINYISESDSV